MFATAETDENSVASVFDLCRVLDAPAYFAAEAAAAEAAAAAAAAAEAAAITTTAGETEKEQVSGEVESAQSGAGVNGDAGEKGEGGELVTLLCRRR